MDQIHKPSCALLELGAVRRQVFKLTNASSSVERHVHRFPHNERVSHNCPRLISTYLIATRHQHRVVDGLVECMKTDRRREKRSLPARVLTHSAPCCPFFQSNEGHGINNADGLTPGRCGREISLHEDSTTSPFTVVRDSDKAAYRSGNRTNISVSADYAELTLLFMQSADSHLGRHLDRS